MQIMLVTAIVTILSYLLYQSRVLHLQKHSQLFFASCKAFFLTCIHSLKDGSSRASSHAWITHLFEQSNKERTFSVLTSVKEESLSQLWTWYFWWSWNLTDWLPLVVSPSVSSDSRRTRRPQIEESRRQVSCCWRPFRGQGNFPN